ncbi:hypothetical protein [Algoriphagus namhaensis]
MAVLSKPRAFKILKEFFLRNGYLRLKDKSKFEKLGSQKYKNGFEVRLIAKNEKELKKIRHAISAMGLYVANSFTKGNQIVQPIYGREITERFEQIKRKEK